MTFPVYAGMKPPRQKSAFGRQMQCHDSTKRHIELYGYRPDIGLDGWSLDPRHPVYNHGR